MAIIAARAIQFPSTTTGSRGNLRATIACASKLANTPTMIPPTASRAVSRRTTFTIYNREAPMDYRLPISRVRSMTAVYIA
jgi:hypothetical protein